MHIQVLSQFFYVKTPGEPCVQRELLIEVGNSENDFVSQPELLTVDSMRNP